MELPCTALDCTLMLRLFFPWVFSKTLVRDAHARQDLGVVALRVKVEVACHGSACRCSIDGAATAAWRTDFEIDSAG